jgi:phosphoribosyl-AMP cyclohydrolase
MSDFKLEVDSALLDQVKFDDKGLVPAIAQHYRTGEILMQAFMNRESLEKTLESGNATYWSRSRRKLWMKGETSGNVSKVMGILMDCDGDSLILLVDQKGPACHTGEDSCFYRTLAKQNSPDQGHACSGCGGCCG